MPRFRYLRDPVFLGCVGLYAATAAVRATGRGGWFLHGYANDLLCVGVWVPVMVTLTRATGLRKHDRPPTAAEVLVALAVWSVMFELWLPTQAWLPFPHTADPFDVLVYAAGAAVALTLWWRPRGLSPPRGGPGRSRPPASPRPRARRGRAG